MPALLTRTPGVPTSASTRSSEARSVTSARRTPSPSRTSIPTTVAPASASARVHTGPRFPSAPVTTATRPRRPSDIIAGKRRAGVLQRLDRQGLVEVLEGQRLVLPQRVAQRASDHVVELVRRQPVARRLQHQILAPEHVAGRERRRGDDLLAHLRDRVRLARVRDLLPVAERDA